MPGRLRIVLLPIAVLLELVLLASGWILALMSPAKAMCLSHWAESRLPSLGWYVGRSPVQVQERKH